MVSVGNYGGVVSSHDNIFYVGPSTLTRGYQYFTNHVHLSFHRCHCVAAFQLQSFITLQHIISLRGWKKFHPLLVQATQTFQKSHDVLSHGVLSNNWLILLIFLGKLTYELRQMSLPSWWIYMQKPPKYLKPNVFRWILFFLNIWLWEDQTPLLECMIDANSNAMW